MENTIRILIEKYGSQVRVAEALGVGDRTFRNYVRSPQTVPLPMCRFMRTLAAQDDTPPPPLPVKGNPEAQT